MKQKHKYAQALRWIADGEEVQARIQEGPWALLNDFNNEHSTNILKGAVHSFSDYEFRIKPKTVKIGSREVEAPVLAPEAGTELWYANTAHGCRIEPFRFSENPHPHIADRVASGQAFANSEAALAAHEAISALLRGDA